MEYHQNRFTDYSLLLFKKKVLVAVFPANLHKNTLYSHQGLTFGGLITAENVNSGEVHELLFAVIAYAKKHNFSDIIIKTIPRIYFNRNQDAFLYFLQKKGTLIDRNLVMAIDYSKPLQIHKTKRKHFRKNEHIGFQIEETADFSEFWNAVLRPKLSEKYDAEPVHSLQEIKTLQHKFPEQIIQYNISLYDEILAGITIFKNKIIVKSQYGATTEKGEQLRALEYLFMYLIKKFQAENMHYFSMGTVDAETEKGFNSGLLKQKEELGCTGFIQDIYKITCL